MTGTVVSSAWLRAVAQNVLLDQLVERHQRVISRPSLISQDRETERHAFAGKALGLPALRLVLPILLEQEHHEEVGPAHPRGALWKGAGTTTRSLGRCSGNGFLAGRLRSKAVTVVV